MYQKMIGALFRVINVATIKTLGLTTIPSGVFILITITLQVKEKTKIQKTW